MINYNLDNVVNSPIDDIVKTIEILFEKERGISLNREYIEHFFVDDFMKIISNAIETIDDDLENDKEL
ncbi:MAG: hypothetical protein WC656_03670 [Sulfurimonas sp.]|jgi:hypothetical protein